MCYECRMFMAGPTLCIVDRKVWKGHGHCPQCGEPGIAMGTKWRAPKSNDEKAWKRIESGDFLWDHPNISSPGDRWTKPDIARPREKPESEFVRFWPGHLNYKRRDWIEEIRNEILRRMNDAGVKRTAS